MLEDWGDALLFLVYARFGNNLLSDLQPFPGNLTPWNPLYHKGFVLLCTASTDDPLCEEYDCLLIVARNPVYMGDGESRGVTAVLFPRKPNSSG